MTQRGRGRYSFWIHTLSPPPDFELSDSPKGVGGGVFFLWIHSLSPPPDFELSDSPKGVGGGILSGFTHYPHHLIFDISGQCPHKARKTERARGGKESYKCNVRSRNLVSIDCMEFPPQIKAVEGLGS